MNSSELVIAAIIRSRSGKLMKGAFGFLKFPIWNLSVMIYNNKCSFKLLLERCTGVYIILG